MLADTPSGVTRTPTHTKHAKPRATPTVHVTELPSKTPPSTPTTTSRKHHKPVHDAKDGASTKPPPFMQFSTQQLTGDAPKPTGAKRSMPHVTTTIPKGAAGDLARLMLGLPARPDHQTWFDNAMTKGRHAVIAHRGNTELHDNAPTSRNTLQSMKDAAHDGASDVVEGDIQALKDGTLVIWHEGDDSSIDDIKDLTRADLKDHPQIPTLRQWAKLAEHEKLNLMAEFKDLGLDGDADGDKTSRIGRALRILQNHVKPKHLVAMSFDADAVRAIHDLDWRVPVGLVPDRGSGADSVPDQVDQLGFKPAFIEIADDDINEDNLAAMSSQGIGVLTGKDGAYLQSSLLEDPRVQGILTNKPTQAWMLRQGLIYANSDDSTWVNPYNVPSAVSNSGGSHT